MLERIEVRDAGPAPSMVLDLAPRLNLLTGDNGLGKTFLLDVAWFAMTGTWPGYPAAPRREPGSRPTIDVRLSDEERAYGATIHFDYDTQAWQWSIGDPSHSPSDVQERTLTIYARVDGGFSIFDPLRKSGHHPLPLGQMSVGLSSAFHLNADQVWNGLQADDHDGTVLCNGLIRDWTIWQLQRSTTFDVLSSVLEGLSPHPGETIRPGAATTRLSVQDVRDIPTIELPYGTIPIVLASAGMRRVLSLAYLLVWTWREHVEAAKLKNAAPCRHLVLLFDEVEAHLHPRWQRVMLPSLLKVIRHLDPTLDLQLVASTHAPLVLASVEPLFEESRDALFVFDVEEQRVMVRREPWIPRGDASAWLTSDVFDLNEARSVEAERAITAAMAALRDPGLPIEEVKRIHHELHAVLGETDPFWPRWLARAQRAGIEP